MLNAQLLRVVLGVLQFDLSILFKIALVAHNDDGQGVSTLLTKLFDPHGHLRKRVQVGDVIHDQRSLGASIIDGIKAVVLLLTCGVPNRKPVSIGLNSLHGVWILDPDRLLETGGIDCALLSVIELIHTKPDSNRCFTDSGCTEQKRMVRTTNPRSNGDGVRVTYPLQGRRP